MVKTKKKAKVTKITTVARARTGLDAAGAAYAKLLADPCGAPLVHPVYSGGEGGYLIRADSYFGLAGGAGQTSGAVLWTPGAIGTTNSELVVIQGADELVVTPGVGNGNSPGKAFLAQVASNARCVAACIKVTYLGTEATRRGRVHVGHASGAVLDIGDNASVQTMIPLCQHFTRTPASTVELVWKPNDADQLFTDPTATTLASEKDRKSSLLVCVAGLPVAEGALIQMTAIYEWQPIRNQGLAIPSLSKSPSNSTLDEVVNYLIRTGVRWVRGIANEAGNSLAYEVSQMFGNVPSLLRSSRTGLGM